MELIVRLGERVEEVSLERRGDRWLVRLGDDEQAVEVQPVRGPLLSVRLDGRQLEAAVERGAGGVWRVGLPDGDHEVEVVDPLTWVARQSHADVGGTLRQRVTAYMPGRVVELLVSAGDEVTVGQGLIVLEAMKMENEIQAETAGTVEQVHVEPGQAVEGGQLLLEIG